MLQCLYTEIKTLLSMKSILICFLLMLVIPAYLVFNQYSSTAQSIEHEIGWIEEMSQMFPGEEIDLIHFNREMMLIHYTLSPRMAINNAFAALTAIGMVIFPMLAAFFIGNEYSSSRTIKAKITYYSLSKVVFSKLIVLILGLLIFFIIFGAVSWIITQLSWNHYLADYFIESTTASAVSVSHISIIAVTLFSLLLYAAVSFLFAFLFKSNIVGIIVAFIMFYINLPTRYDLGAMLSNMHMETFYFNDRSFFSFTSPIANPLSASASFVILLFFLILFVFMMLILSRKQRNS